MPTIGAVARPQLAPERLPALAGVAERSGLPELWLWEDCFAEGGISTAAAVLASTHGLRVGIGILPTPLRNVALTAMEVATLARMFPGRLTVGVGHGVQAWMGQVGARPTSPLTLLSEYATALRRLLAGERVSAGGEYVRLDGVRLDWPPTVPVPLLAGATGPRTMRLTGQVADGTILTAGTTPDGVRQARAVIEQGRAEAGRDGHHEVVVYVLAATGRGARKRAQAEASTEEWNLEPHALVPLVGDAGAVAAGVRQWFAAGADRVVLQPTADEPDPEGFVHWVATDVAAAAAASAAADDLGGHAGDAP
jgi:alkanesulfonate monooxygenase SsuD/methylene tetrahydromethanopterin reductase-like flavin-dependent oxidoreductase (luciferase family)